MNAREPTGEELFRALAAIRERGKESATIEVVFQKLYGMWRRHAGFYEHSEEDLVVETCLAVIDAEFRGQSAGEAVVWITKVARNKSIDQKRREKRERERDRRFAIVSSQTDHSSATLEREIGADELEDFILELRDELLPAHYRKAFPRRGAARSQAELAYLAAMERDDYERVLAEAADEKERQRLHKQMGRGRDELWIPFLQSIADDAAYEDWQCAVIQKLIEALVGTRRADHGRSRSGGSR